MPRQLLSVLFLALFGLVAACQSKPEGLPAAATQRVSPAAPAVARPPLTVAEQPAADSIVGTYRQAADSTDCDCDLAVTIWRAGHQLHYRMVDYPEKGFATAEEYADGQRSLSFVSTPKPHEKAHEWEGSLEGDTLLVQTYGNSMNEYENFVGGCSCKFLTLIKQR